MAFKTLLFVFKMLVIQAWFKWKSENIRTSVLSIHDNWQ